MQVEFVVQQVRDRGNRPGLLGFNAAGVEFGAVALKQLVENGVTVGEKPVQRGVGHPGPVGDRPRRGGVDTLFIGDRGGRVEDARHRQPAAGLHRLAALNRCDGHRRPLDSSIAGMALTAIRKTITLFTLQLLPPNWECS